MWPFTRSRKQPATAIPGIAELTQQTTLPLGVTGVLGPGVVWGQDGGPFAPGRWQEAFGPNGVTRALPWGAVYWRMLQHPVVRFARATFNGPIGAGAWEFVPVDDDFDEATTEKYAKLLKRNLTANMRATFLDHVFRGRDLGRAPFELVWDVAGGEYRLVDAVPLPIEITGVYRALHGQFAGLSVPVMDEDVATRKLQQSVDPVEFPGGVPALPFPYKCWLYVHDDYARMLIGRSWLENIRSTAWKDWEEAYQQLSRLGRKLSGISAVVTAPAGDIPGVQDSAGKPVSYRQAAETLIRGFEQGAVGGYLPSLAIPVDGKGNLDALKMMAELIKASAVNFQLLDFGDVATAINGQLDRIRHDEELIFEGALLSPRVGLQTHKGSSKADSETHTSSASIVIEAANDDIARQMQSVVDAILVLNFGRDAAGTMRIKCPPLENRKVDQQVELFKAAITSQDAAAASAMLDTIDADRFLREIDFSLSQPWETSMNDAKAEAAAQQEQQMKAAAAKAGQNGNGSNGNGSGKRGGRITHT